MKVSPFLEALLLDLPKMHESHSPTHPCYLFLKKIAKQEIASLFASGEKRDFPPFGPLTIPYTKMGAVDSLDLFGLDELILFSFYWQNRHRYKRVLDVGGNIGLHSILLSRAGFHVTTFEPDPAHFENLLKNLKTNHCTSVTPHSAAVSFRTGTADFVRVLGNTTSSHIAGSKQPYGALETLTVPLRDLRELLPTTDLMKMDVEGHEKEILVHTEKNDWKHLDAVIEVGSADNAKHIFAHLQKIGVHSYAQKINWHRVKCLEDMPTSHRDGSLFISLKSAMPWSE